MSSSSRLAVFVTFTAVAAIGGPACSSSSAAPTTDAGKVDSAQSTDSTDSIDTSMPPRDANVYAWNDAAPSCQPSSSAGFAPVKVLPVKNPVCTAEQIVGLVTECFDPLTRTAAQCAAWQGVAANVACQNDCPVTSSFAAAPALHNPPPPPKGPWGPLVQIVSHDSILFLNLGGCLAAVDPSSAAQACADAINAQFECEYFVCAANCPIPVDADASATEDADIAFQNCTLAADSGPCMSYANAAIACTAALPVSGPGEFCLDGTLLSEDSASFDPAFEKLIGDQCGGKPSPDAGPDSAAPDSGDAGAPDASSG